MRVDVVIVGAGIGGAVAALALGRRGWRVAILERERAATRFVRPEILWGATPDALDDLGAGNAIRDASVRIEAIEIGGREPWLTITANDFAAAQVTAFSTDPLRTRTIIADAAVATGNVEIHRGITVESLRFDDGRIAGVRAASTDWNGALVIGDDGGNSIVRTALGIQISLATFPIEFVTARIERWPLPANRARVWVDREGSRDGLPVAAFIPWPENEGILLVPLAGDRAQSLFEQSAEGFWTALARVTPMAGALREQLEFPGDFKRVARPFGHAESYVGNGAVLIGDAAHPMTPAGGQGANAAIWDALALADVADAALRAGDVSRERLLAYERLRRPVNEQSVAFSRIARRALSFARFLPIPTVAKTINTLGWPKRRAVRTFATAFVHQR